MSINSAAPFILLSDETNPGVIESYCSDLQSAGCRQQGTQHFGNLQRIHMDKKHTPRTMPPT
jgi:hypothetical protein